MVNNRMVNEEVISKCKEIATFIKETFNADKVILFGSYAYSKPDKDSDIDLFVIMETNQRFPEQGAKIRLEIEENFLIDKPMDILVRTPLYVEQRLKGGDFFIQEIIQKGIEL